LYNEIQNQVITLEKELVAERQAREALVRTSLQLNSLLNLPDLLNAIMSAATSLLEAEASSLMLIDEATGTLTFAVSTDVQDASIKTLRIPANQGIAGWALEHDQLVVVDDVTSDPRFYKNIDQQSGFTTRSILAVPLKIRDSQIGVVEVMNKCSGATFTERDRDIATAFAALAAVAIDNAHLYRKLADALVDSRMSYRL
jgi:GAF domain-containing protein